MTYSPIPHFAPKTESYPGRRLARAVGAVASFFEMLAAAARVARTVEARREPAKADLRTLGINQKLPAAW